MQESRPSRTALRVALWRAAHQIFDEPKVFDDPIAVALLDPDAVQRAKADSRGLSRLPRSLRAFVAARSRYAEDQLERAAERGVKQYVIVGAGLDTFAYRNPHAERGLRVFEVDYPATQEWKRERLAAGGIATPASVTFAPVDFERRSLPEALQQAGFDAGQPAFFSWLGVTMYLARETVMSTFRFIASGPPGGGVALDYVVSPASLTWTGRLALDALSRRVEKAGEPFRTFFAPGELLNELGDLGFWAIEDLGATEINARYFRDRADGLRVSGVLGRLMSAEV